MPSKYVDSNAIIQVIGCIYNAPHLLDQEDKYNISEEDFPETFHQILFGTIYRLYELGAKEVHVRPACPPIMFGCKYLNFSRSTSNMDLITRRVIADLEGTSDISEEVLNMYCNPDHEKHDLMVQEICKRMNFTTLKYHRLDDLIKALEPPQGLAPVDLYFKNEQCQKEKTKATQPQNNPQSTAALRQPDRKEVSCRKKEL